MFKSETKSNNLNFVLLEIKIEELEIDSFVNVGATSSLAGILRKLRSCVKDGDKKFLLFMLPTACETSTCIHFPLMQC